MTIRELTITALKRNFYKKDGDKRTLTCVCRKCGWYRSINTVMICGRRQHWEELKNTAYRDACCPYVVKELPSLSVLSDRSVMYLDDVIEELKRYGQRCDS